MEKEKQKIFYDDKVISICTLIIALLFAITAIVFLACSNFGIVYIALGIILSVIAIIFWISMFFVKWYIVLDVDTISLTTLYGRILKQKKRKDLIKIECHEQRVVDRLSINGKKKFVFMFFAENIYVHECLRDSLEEPDLMLALFSPHKMKVLEEYIEMTPKKK